jgi:hypothetical protein
MTEWEGAKERKSARDRGYLRLLYLSIGCCQKNHRQGSSSLMRKNNTTGGCLHPLTLGKSYILSFNF